MKIIHTSDLHLKSPLTSRLSHEKMMIRSRELEENFAILCEKAKEYSAEVMIIAGDLFDSERIDTRSLDTVFTVIRRHPDLKFLYLVGNHEGNVLVSSGMEMPSNLYLFGKGWTYFDFHGLRISGRNETSKDMMKTLDLKDGKNIVVLHGELIDRSDEGGVIGTFDLEGCGADYVALGHYHSYSAKVIDKKTVAVYCGTPEGRGFDEVGECGFVLIDTDGEKISHKFIPSAKRKQIIEKVDISYAQNNSDVENLIAEKIRAYGRENLLRIVLIGEREPTLKLNTGIIEARFSKEYFYFEIKDKSKMKIDLNSLKFDKSLKGEFLRLALSEGGIDDETREKIIECGISALSGDIWEAKE